MAQTVSLGEWLQLIETVQVRLRPDSEGYVLSASELVNEIHEERDADILRSIGFGDSADDSTN